MRQAGAWRLLTVSLALAGKVEEANAALAQTLTLQPDLSLDHVESNNIYADPADRARFREGLKHELRSALAPQCRSNPSPCAGCKRLVASIAGPVEIRRVDSYYMHKN